jgi:ketosteroid isomerase-like protein
MRQESIARKAYEAFNQGDFDAALGLCTPDITVQRASGSGAVQGSAAIRDFFAPDAFEWQQVEPREFVEHRNRLLVELWARARGRESGVEVEQLGFHVITFRDEKLARIEVYFDRADALKAFGRPDVEDSAVLPSDDDRE